MKAVPTPLAPLDLRRNRKTSPHGKHGMVLGDDELGRERGEEFVRSVTSGGNAGDEMHEEEVIEEVGGPFVETTAETEFADGTDASNPEDAEREALPTVSRMQRK